MKLLMANKHTHISLSNHFLTKQLLFQNPHDLTLKGASHYCATDIPGHESHSCQNIIIRSMQAFSGMHKEMLRALSCGDRVNLLKIERSGIW